MLWKENKKVGRKCRIHRAGLTEELRDASYNLGVNGQDLGGRC